MTKRIKGCWGEDLAVNFLLNNGYFVIERNYHSRWGEIDIIAKKEEEIIFIEVKTRFTSDFGSGEEAINWQKKDKMQKTARKFLGTCADDLIGYRFDAIILEVDQQEKKVLIKHTINILF